MLSTWCGKWIAHQQGQDAHSGEKCLGVAMGGQLPGAVQSTAGMDLVWAEDTACASRPEGGKLQWFRIAAVRWEEGDGGTGEVGRTQSWKPSGQVPSVSCRSLLRNESSVEAGW